MNFGEDLDRCARKLCFSFLVFLAYDLIQDHKVIREKGNHPGPPQILQMCKSLISNSKIWGWLLFTTIKYSMWIKQLQILCSHFCCNVSKE